MRIGLHALAASAFLMSASANAAAGGVTGAGSYGDESSVIAINTSPPTESGEKIDATSDVATREWGPVASCQPASLSLGVDTEGFAAIHDVSYGSQAATSHRVEAAVDGATFPGNVSSRITLAYAIACVVGAIVFAMWGSQHSKHPFGN